MGNVGPGTELYDRREVSPGAGQDIISIGTHHHAGGDQFSQPLRQQRGRHLRNAATDIVEFGRPGQHFAKQHQRPSRRQKLRRHRDGTKLAV
jgi:hypothetical protein